MQDLSAWAAISDAPHILEFDWQAASAPGANDGHLTFWVDGTQQTNVTGMDTDTRRVDSVSLGAKQGIDDGTRGTYYFDSFVSRRESYIGTSGLLPGAQLGQAPQEKGSAKLAALIPYDQDASHPALSIRSTDVLAPITLTAASSILALLASEPRVANPAPQAQNSTTTITYTYDPLYRLTSADYSDGHQFAYDYNAMGSVLTYTQTISGQTIVTTYTYNAAYELTTARASNDPITWHYAYDGNGSLVEITPNGSAGSGAKRYTYNAAGYLVKTESYDGTGYQAQAEIAYNGLGMRLRMTAYAGGLSVTTRYAVDAAWNGQPLAATSGGQTTYTLYGRGPLAEKTGSWAYALPDGTNTPRQLTDAAGSVTLTGRYTPWGDTLEVSGTGNFTWGYFGGLMDAATGLLYMGNGQYYDPATGRFLTRDAQPGKLNPYVPWGQNDPSGMLVGPLALLVLLRRRKKNQVDRFLLILVLSLAVGTSVVACQPGPPPQPPTQPGLPPQPPTLTPGGGTPGGGSLPTPLPPLADTPTPTQTCTSAETPTLPGIDVVIS